MNRIWHPWHLWECVPAGMYHLTTENKEQNELRYAYFLRDDAAFRSSIEQVFDEWPVSCEHFLTNDSMNRIAWIGQAAMCMATGVSRAYRGGFMRLTDQEKRIANATAAEYLQLWVERHESNLSRDNSVQTAMGPAGLPFGYPGRSSSYAGGRYFSAIVQGCRGGDSPE